ncbi:hypothetical protein D3C78_1854080 [compost metagenome]
MLAQDFADLDRVARYVAAVDAVLVARDAQRPPACRREQSADEFSYGFSDHLGLRIFHVVEQVDHLPAAFLGDLAQGGAGVRGDRTGHFL